MPTTGTLKNEEDNDSYLISLLKRDASEANKNRYSTSGLVSRKRPKDAPKPNTRFLGNLVREVDSHNAALKAREEEESSVRLKRSRREECVGLESEKDRDRGGKRVRIDERKGRWANALSGLGGGRGQRLKSRDGREEDMRAARREKSHKEEPKSSGKSDEEERNIRRDKSRPPEQRRKRQRRSSSHDLNKSLLPQPSETRYKRRASPPRRECRDTPSSPEDPLERFLGPRPPPENLPRGRGALKSSAIDARFASGYDPRTDTLPADGVDDPQKEERGDDWDMALEALRDRMKWRTKGAERLRAAGFTEDEVGSFIVKGDGSGEREKGVEDVRWKGRGEAREWDRGKTEHGEGITVKAEWAK
ncbi:hypothetical protein LTR62_002248 [Meristemomyces frigidus]|uniref:Pre-mRNA-splicing factor 38B n=1 Tax=Meristemomyces frigidus TaxID=1508187 RepID=A0AAN7YHT1_9PEZI|nr:hypothetical protein LTR62_002248 [Meristemomyces frigidus]